MIRLKVWQWLILATPIALVITFLLIAAGIQIHTWGLNWIWGVLILILAAWRSLLGLWTQPLVREMEAVITEVNQELTSSNEAINRLVGSNTNIEQLESQIQSIIAKTRNDQPIWQDWITFWQRCQELVVAIAQTYHPEVKYPLLNIYVPQAYSLIRGTVDDLDRWMQKLSPALNQVTVGQAYQAYEIYQKLEPSARKLWQIWDWGQWLWNPVAAAAKTVSKPINNQANQQLLINLSQMLREAALKNLAQQAIALYSGNNLPSDFNITVPTPSLPKAQTQTLRGILEQAQPLTEVEQRPLNILVVGRTGAGKSSLINSLFQQKLAQVDVLPTTEEIQHYHWQSDTGETLTLWDTPGYEQVKRSDLRQLVLDYAKNADLALLVTPALDPSLQMDYDFLQDLRSNITDLPLITIITQVDRLRPIREWQPPYDWQEGQKPKEIAIREATAYRYQLLGEICDLALPVVTSDPKIGRNAWNIDILSLALLDAIAPSKQLRLARFLRNLEARTLATAKIIDHYTLQMTTTQGLTALLKSPVLHFISTLTTGSPTLAYLLAEKIPIEQLPVVIGKLQMAYDLFSLLNPESATNITFDLLTLWPLLLENPKTPDRNAWAFGHALVEYWTKNLSVIQFQERFNYYLQ